MLNHNQGKMNILVIDEEFPVPLNTGKRLRSFNLIKHLASKANITYFAYGTEDTDLSLLHDNNIDIIAVPPPNRKKSGVMFYWHLFANLFSRKPFIATNHYTSIFQDTLNNVLRTNNFDLIIAEWTPYAMYFKDLPADLSEIKRIIVAHNIESMIWKRYLTNERNPVKRWYIGIQQRKLARFENDCFSWADGAIAVSADDAEKIKRMNNDIDVMVIENGVDTNYFKCLDNPVDKNTLVFTGSMDWRPNQDAVCYFIDEIFPTIKKENPQIRVYFVGRKPPAGIQRFGRIDGVTITGTVDDVRPYIDKASLIIVPIRIGGGTRLKILEAMAMEKTVISTSIGAEGLDVTNGENIIIADDPDNFAHAIIKQLGDPDASRRLGTNGRNLVEKYYDWQVLGKKYFEFIGKVVD